MRKRKAVYEDAYSPKIQRTAKYFAQFFKGTEYKKNISRKHFVTFREGRYFSSKPYPSQFHKEIEFQYVRSGRISYYLDGRIYPLKKRHLLIIRPNEVHGVLGMSANEILEFVTFIFPPKWTGWDFRARSLPREIILTEEEAAKLDMICGQIRDEAHNKETGYEKIIKLKFQEFCFFVQRLASRPPVREKVHPIIVQLKEYVDQHFPEELRIGGLGKKYGYTEEHLTRQFKRYTGASLKRYLLQRRVIEARLLLESKPELKLTAVAERVGFKDYNLFYRAFKIFSCITPTMYRQLLLKKAAAN